MQLSSIPVLFLFIVSTCLSIPAYTQTQLATLDIPASKRVSPLEIEKGYKPVLNGGFDFITTATDSKKRWEGKRPKGGNGPGIYKFYPVENCDNLMDGNWKDYKLDGPFRKLYKGIPVFEGIAKDGVVLSGTAYGFQYVHRRITQSHISTEEKENFRANIMGTHIAPVYTGTLQSSAKSGEAEYYCLDNGTAFTIRESAKGLIVLSAAKGQWKKTIGYSISSQPPMGSMDYYFLNDKDNLQLTNSITYTDGKIDGLVTLYKADGSRVEADFKNNMPASEGQTVLRNAKGIITAVYDHKFTCLIPNGYSEHLTLNYGGWAAYFPENGKPFRRFETGGNASSNEVANIPAPDLTISVLNKYYPEIPWQTGRYSGETTNGIPNGWGRLYGVYKGGDYMEGNFKDGKPIGYTMLVANGISSRSGDFGYAVSQLEIYKDGKAYKSIWGQSEALRNKIVVDERKEKAQKVQAVRQEETRIADRWYNVDAKGTRTRRELPGKEGWFQHVIYPPQTVVDGITYPATSGFYVIFRSGTDEITKDKYFIATTQSIGFGMDENRNTFREYPMLWAANMIVKAYYGTDDRIGELTTYAGKVLKLGLKDGNNKAKLILFEDNRGSVVVQLPSERYFKNNTTVTMKMIFTTKKVDQNFLREPEVMAFF